MDGAMALNNPINLSASMPKTKERKKKVANALKAKLEQAKLNLIYTELEELNIPFERNYETVKDLLNDIKDKVSDIDYNNIVNTAKKVEASLNSMVSELEKGSTNAFTKVMTSDVAKTIGKTIGISLAGRTALLLAPTLGSKAAIATGLAGYGLYRIIKNRKEIIKINETNELNNILQDLETTKEDGKYLDTRFPENIQNDIREFLKTNNIDYEDTGYRSIRQAIYSLDNEKKISLCNLLNDKLGRGIEIDERIKKAKRSLNVVAAGAAGLSAGATLGINIANTINSVDPALTAGVLNGTVLAAWAEKVAGTPWFTALSGGVGLVGSEILEHIPVVGTIASKVFAAENLASFATAGAIGGLAVSTTLGVASAVKSVFNRSKSKKDTEEFLKLDNEKYGESDKPELEAIAKKLHEPANLGELAIVDIVNGYLKDENIELEGNTKSISDLKIAISKLSGEEQKKAQKILNQIEINLNNDPEFVQKLKKAGKISICLFTSGLAAMSVYDIIKGGTFLPELSKKIFPDNNIYNPVPIPKPIDEPFNVTNVDEKALQEQSREIYQGLSGRDYYTEYDGTYKTTYGDTFQKFNPGFEGTYTETALVNAGTQENFVDNLLKVLGIGSTPKSLVPNIPAICEKVDALSPEQLYGLYRYINSLSGGPDGDPPMLAAFKGILGYEKFLDKVTNYIGGFERQQELHNIVIDVSKKLSTGAIPFSTAMSILNIAKKKDTNDSYSISQKEIEKEENKEIAATMNM